MKQVSCAIESVHARPATFNRSRIFAVAAFFVASSPHSTWSQSAWPNYPHNALISITSGRMGLGNTAPAYRLDVSGDARANSVIINGSGSYVPGALFSDSNWGMIFRAKTNNPAIASFLFSTAADKHLMTLKENGNVGIGTSNPAARLDIQGGNIKMGPSEFTLDQGGALELGNSSARGTSPYIDFHYGIGQPQDHNVRLINNADGRLSAFANSFYISGNVGIGTTSPQSRLAVNGTITAKEVVVTANGWADYVFHPGYRLPSLGETEAYIRAHHHLPDIPSESEVLQQGVGVGEMQVKLLAKIEELTLHMIQAEQSNSRMRQTISELSQRVRSLEAGGR